MTNRTLITTIFDVDPVILCITKFSPSKVILLTEEDAADKKVESIETIEKTFGSMIEIKRKYTSLYDHVQVASDVADLIDEEHDKGNQIITNVSGSRKTQAFGALYGAYARKDMVKRVVYVTEEDHEIIDFPILSFNISTTKKSILEQIQSGTSSVGDIAEKLDISKGMTYNHLRELKSLGYITDENGYEVTDSGKLAAI